MSFYESKWFKEAIGYQIYIKSFKDSNDDGIGDINGIIEKLDYFVDLGVNLLWICPFYESPMVDNGYDVSDFYQVDPVFGTIKDFKKLIFEANKRKIKIIVDLILNQTSNKHYWFKESRKSKDNRYRNYYIWEDGKTVNGNIVEPTNWASFFGGSAWNYDKKTQQYYMKIFSNEMPDLNWSNKNVRKSMQKVAKYWLDLGVFGFRVDAVSHLGRKEKIIDSKMNKNLKYQPDWKMFSNLDVTFNYLEELKEEVFSKKDIVTIGEVGGSATIKDAIKYSGIKKGSLNMVFNFDHCFKNNVHKIKSVKEEVKVDLKGLKAVFNKWQNGLYEKAWNALYWLNHDHPRLISHYGDIKKPKLSSMMLAVSLYFMWGTPFIYQGEELNMSNYPFKKISDFNDVAVHNLYEQKRFKNSFDEKLFIYQEGLKSRDNARTIMSWNDSKYAGFSSKKPWFHLDINYSVNNVEKAVKDKDSLYNFYKKIIKIRNDKRYLKTIIYGSYKQFLEDDEDVYCYLRKKDKEILVIANFFNIEKEISLPSFKVKEVILSNYKNYNQDFYLLSKLKLKPYEALVLLVERKIL